MKAIEQDNMSSSYVQDVKKDVRDPGVAEGRELPEARLEAFISQDQNWNERNSEVCQGLSSL